MALAVCMLSACAPGGCACADDGSKDRATLTAGETLSGRLEGFESSRLQWRLADGQLLLIPIEAIRHVEYAGPPANSADDEQSVRGGLTAEPGQKPFRPVQDAFVTAKDLVTNGLSEWTKRLEVGARFVDGNSDNDFLDIAGKFDRDTGDWLGQLDFGGQYSESSGDPKTNRWWGNLTFDYGRKGKWILFATSKNEFDEFENLDYRGTFSAGVGYRFVKKERRRLIARLGPAYTFEQFRDPFDRRETADAFGELEIDWPVFWAGEFESKTSVHPSIENYHIFRLVSNNGLLFHLDEDGRWSLKLGLRYELNNRPARNRGPYDVTSSVLLVYTRK